MLNGLRIHRQSTEVTLNNITYTDSVPDSSEHWQWQLIITFSIIVRSLSSDSTSLRKMWFASTKGGGLDLWMQEWQSEQKGSWALLLCMFFFIPCWSSSALGSKMFSWKMGFSHNGSNHSLSMTIWGFFRVCWWSGQCKGGRQISWDSTATFADT